MTRKKLQVAVLGVAIGMAALACAVMKRSPDVYGLSTPMTAKKFLQRQGLAARDVSGIYRCPHLGVKSWREQAELFYSGLRVGRWEWPPKTKDILEDWNTYSWSGEVADEVADKIDLFPEDGILIMTSPGPEPQRVQYGDKDESHECSRGSIKELNGMGYWANTVFPPVKRFILYHSARADFSRKTLSFEVEDAHQWIADVAKSAIATRVWMDVTWPKNSKITRLIDLREPFDGLNIAYGEQIIRFEPSDDNRIVTVETSRD